MTAFSTRFGQFKYKVMPFGLYNAPSTFQSYINQALQDILDVFCTAYLDDVLIFSENLDDHHRHVREVLERLRTAKLYVDIDKSEFDVQEVKYLGMIVSIQGMKMDPSKVDTVLQWNAPRTLKDLQAFLGFANFYRRFIKGFSKTALPLTKATKKDEVFRWSPQMQVAFDTLKQLFSTQPILVHFDPDKPSVVEVDASDVVVAGILSQYDSEDVLRPVAYFLKKMSPQECNYEIYDKELLAIIRAFEEWRPELASIDPFESRHCLLRSQEPGVFHDDEATKQKISSMG